MADTTYLGSCHCGAVKFAVTMAPPETAYACNCSICRRAGWLLAFVPGSAFAQTAGQDALTDYQFGKQHLHHTFCKVCGVRPFSRGNDKQGNPTVAVNLRCLEGLVASKLPVQEFDGASL